MRGPELSRLKDPMYRKEISNAATHLVALGIFSAYMHLYHRLEVDLHSEIPKKGPALAVMTHASLLDGVALWVADSYKNPWTQSPVREDFFQIPVLGKILESFKTYPVKREGKDIATLKKILKELKAGHTIIIAAEGTRTRDGHLQPIDNDALQLILKTAGEGTPVIPMTVIGAYEAMPPGAKIPRPKKIIVRGGKPIDLSSWAGRKNLSEEELNAAARHIQDTFDGIMNPENRRETGTPAVWTKDDYMKRNQELH